MEEREGEAQCTWIKVKNQPNARNIWIRGLVTRSGKKVEERDAQEETEDGKLSGGTKNTAESHSQGSGEKGKKLKVPGRTG